MGLVRHTWGQTREESCCMAIISGLSIMESPPAPPVGTGRVPQIEDLVLEIEVAASDVQQTSRVAAYTLRRELHEVGSLIA